MYCWILNDSRRMTQLCSRGSVYMRDVLQYLYFKHGKAFSLLDWQRGYDDVQIELPHEPMLLLSQYTVPFNDRRSSERSNTEYRTRERLKSCAYKTSDVNRNNETKDSRFTNRVDGDYITVYAVIPAITIPLRVRQADLLHNTTVNK